MKIKIGDTWYDSKETPVCLELSDDDYNNIMTMMGSKIAFFPDDYEDREKMLDWMN